MTSSSVGELCNGSTYDSDSYCLGSNPSSPAISLHGQAVKTLPSQGKIRGSIPLGGAKAHSERCELFYFIGNCVKTPACAIVTIHAGLGGSGSAHCALFCCHNEKNARVRRRGISRGLGRRRERARRAFGLYGRKRCGIIGLCRQIGFYGWFPPQRRTEAEVMLMSNVELLNTIIAIAGLVFAAYAAGAQSRR